MVELEDKESSDSSHERGGPRCEACDPSGAKAVTEGKPPNINHL